MSKSMARKGKRTPPGHIPETHQKFWADPEDPRHGTEHGYSNLKCKCDRCRRAKADACEEDRQNRILIGLPDLNDPRHGTENGYRNYGCRCDKCRAEWSRVTNRRRKAREARRKAEKVALVAAEAVAVAEKEAAQVNRGRAAAEKAVKAAGLR